MLNPQPRPEPRARQKAARERLQAKAHLRVYAEVTARDGGVCRICQLGWRVQRHHLRGRRSTTTADVCLVCDLCHDDLHVKPGGKKLRLYGDADKALTVERRVGNRWEFWKFV